MPVKKVNPVAKVGSVGVDDEYQSYDAVDIALAVSRQNYRSELKSKSQIRGLYEAVVTYLSKLSNEDIAARLEQYGDAKYIKMRRNGSFSRSQAIDQLAESMIIRLSKRDLEKIVRTAETENKQIMSDLERDRKKKLGSFTLLSLQSYSEELGDADLSKRKGTKQFKKMLKAKDAEYKPITDIFNRKHGMGKLYKELVNILKYMTPTDLQQTALSIGVTFEDGIKANSLISRIANKCCMYAALLMGKTKLVMAIGGDQATAIEDLFLYTTFAYLNPRSRSLARKDIDEKKKNIKLRQKELKIKQKARKRKAHTEDWAALSRGIKAEGVEDVGAILAKLGTTLNNIKHRNANTLQSEVFKMKDAERNAVRTTYNVRYGQNIPLIKKPDTPEHYDALEVRDKNDNVIPGVNYDNESLTRSESNSINILLDQIEETRLKGNTQYTVEVLCIVVLEELAQRSRETNIETKGIRAKFKQNIGKLKANIKGLAPFVGNKLKQKELSKLDKEIRQTKNAGSLSDFADVKPTTDDIISEGFANIDNSVKGIKIGDVNTSTNELLINGFNTTNEILTDINESSNIINTNIGNINSYITKTESYFNNVQQYVEKLSTSVNEVSSNLFAIKWNIENNTTNELFEIKTHLGNIYNQSVSDSKILTKISTSTINSSGLNIPVMAKIKNGVVDNIKDIDTAVPVAIVADSRYIEKQKDDTSTQIDSGQDAGQGGKNDNKKKYERKKKYNLQDRKIIKQIKDGIEKDSNKAQALVENDEILDYLALLQLNTKEMNELLGAKKPRKTHKGEKTLKAISSDYDTKTKTTGSDWEKISDENLFNKYTLNRMESISIGKTEGLVKPVFITNRFTDDMLTMSDNISNIASSTSSIYSYISETLPILFTGLQQFGLSTNLAAPTAITAQITSMVNGMSRMAQSMLTTKVHAKGTKPSGSNIAQFITGDSLNKKPNEEIVSIDRNNRRYSVKPVPEGTAASIRSATQPGGNTALSSKERSVPMQAILSSGVVGYTKALYNVSDDDNKTAIKVYTVNTGIDEKIQVGDTEASLFDLVYGIYTSFNNIASVMASNTQILSTIANNTASTVSAVNNVSNAISNSSGSTNPFTNELDFILQGR